MTAWVGNAQKIEIQMNIFSKEQSCRSYVEKKVKYEFPLRVLKLSQLNPRFHRSKAHTSNCDWKESCTVALCYSCPGSVTGARIILPQKLLLSET